MVAALLLVLGAHAQDVELCVQSTTDYDEHSILSGDRLLGSIGVFPLRYAKLEVRLAAGQPTFATSWLDSNGCTTLTNLQHGTEYHFITYSRGQLPILGYNSTTQQPEADLDSVKLFVTKQGGSSAVAFAHEWTDTADATMAMVIPQDTAEQWQNAYVASIEVLHRFKDAIYRGSTPSIHEKRYVVALGAMGPQTGWTPVGSLGSNPARGRVALPTTIRNKHTIAHEVGHLVLGYAGLSDTSGSDLPATDTELLTRYNIPGAACGNPSGIQHTLTSLEHHSIAALEGFADVVAAVTLNDMNGGNCALAPELGVVWDQDQQGPGGVPTNWPFSCEGSGDGDVSGIEFQEGVDGSLSYTFQENQVCNHPCPEFFTTEFDYLLAGWDLATDSNVSLFEFLSMVELAGIYDWKDRCNSATDMVPNRLGSAASAIGIGSEYSEHFGTSAGGQHIANAECINNRGGDNVCVESTTDPDCFSSPNQIVCEPPSPPFVCQAGEEHSHQSCVYWCCGAYY